MNTIYNIGQMNVTVMSGGGRHFPKPLADYRVDAGIEGPGGVNLDPTKTEYLSTPINSSLQCVGTSFFWAGWVRSVDFNNGDYIVSISAAATTSIFDISYSAGVITAQIFAGATNGSFRDVTIGTTTASERWWFIAMWLDIGAGTFNLQVNNGTVASVATSTVIQTAAAPLQFGARSGANTHEGQLLSWCFGKAVPTAGELTFLYNSHSARVYSEVASGQPTLQAKLTSWWNLDDATGGNRLDSVGGNHLTPQFASGTGPVKMAAMTRWLDQSGNANHIVCSTEMNQRPLWIDSRQNGLGVIRHTRRGVDGVGSYGQSGNLALSTRKDLTVLSVVKTAPGGNGSFPWSNWNGSSGIYVQIPATGTRTDEVDNAGGVAGVLTVPAADTYRLLGFQYSSLPTNGLMCFQNGTSGSSRSHATTLTGANAFEIGREQSAGNYHSGDQGDLLIYSDFINPSQLLTIQRRLNSRWGFTVGLPDQYISPRWAGGNYTPGVVRCANDHILVFDRFNSATNRIQACRSRNFGRTWEEPFEVAAPTSTTTALTNSGTCKLSDDSLLLTIGVTPTSGTARVEVWRSTDNGFTWSLRSSVISAGGHSSVYPYGRIISVTVSGNPQLWMPVYGVTGAVSESLLMQSTDNGVTWTLRSVIAADTGTLHFNETSVIGTGGTNYLAIVREESPAGEVGDLYQVTSTDSGATWSAPVYKFDGVSPLLINSLVSGILLFRTYREGATVGSKGIFAHRTTDGGTNWGSAKQLWRNPGGTAFTGYLDVVPVSATEYGGAFRNEGATCTWTRFADSLIP
jgi:hypothetical protein